MRRSVIFIFMFLFSAAAFSDNEISPLSNLPDDMICDAAQVDTFSGEKVDSMQVNVRVWNRSMPNLALEMKSASNGKFFKMGNGYVGNPQNPFHTENCAFMTVQDTTHYVCGLDSEHTPTMREVMASPVRVSASPNRICKKTFCFKLSSCTENKK